MNTIELLSPARDKKCAISAIDYGADAVYLAAYAFGARVNSPNTIDDILQVVNYAHKFNVKVYVTINTILNDQELKDVNQLIKDLYSIKVDAIIIQDMGILELDDLPPIKFFASTQCNNDTIEKIKFLEQAGFSRVILPRELSINEIKKIKENTNIELESFIHGALCVSYSGQCYLSYSIGGRSANRGKCAQPCRKKYSLIDDFGNIIFKDKYLLNLKDFNASNYIKDLINAGITSFKIEGRLKDEYYIKNVTAFYRNLIDSIISEKQRGSLGFSKFDFKPDLNKTFNRGYTDFFLSSVRTKNIFNIDTSKAIGEKIGKVIKVSKDYFILEDNAKSLNKSDGICFLSKNDFIGTNINEVKINRIYPNKIDGIFKGAIIYRNFDSQFNKELVKSCVKRKIPVFIDVIIEKDIIKFNIKDNIYSFEMKVDNIYDKANNKEKMISNLDSQLKKSSDSEFYVSNLNIHYQDYIPFIPVSQINQFRRDLFSLFSDLRLKNYKPEQLYLLKTNHLYPINNLDYKTNIYNKKSKNFYNRHNAKITEMAFESGLSKAGKQVMISKHCLLFACDKCRKIKSNNKDREYFLLDEYNKKYSLKFDCKNCRMMIYY